MADKLIHGTHNRGERSGMHKLREEDVREIKVACNIVPRKILAKQYGVSRRTINDIHLGKRWAWLEAQP